MTRFTLLCTSFVLTALIVAPARAAIYPAYIPQALTALPQGSLLLNNESLTKIAVGGADVSLATVSRIAVAGQPFTSAIRIEVSQAASTGWGILTRNRVPVAVQSGDRFMLVFWARADIHGEESAEGWISALFEEAGGNYDKSFLGDIAPYGAWKQYAFAFESAAAYDSAGAHYGFNFGSRPQTIEIGGIELIHFGSQVTLEQLKEHATRLTYVGREADAPWRAEAAARIEAIRKAHLNISIVDNGEPVAGAQVRFAMKRHAFGFGTAVNAGKILPDGTNTYMEKILYNFNKAVIENHLKWRQWTDNGVATAANAISWLAAQGIPTRGHVLVWPSFERMAQGVSQTDAALLASQIENHIVDAVSRFRGVLPEWDVINEPYDNHDAMDLIGKEAMITWFETARSQDSIVKLYINDYAIVSGDDAAHREHYYSTIQYLIDNGAPLDGIGMQGHFGQNPTPLTHVLARLDRFASFGKEIQITEFDVNTTDEELQADYTRDFLTAVFSHPSVSGFLMWGFWAGAHWRPDCAMYRLDWTEKPNLAAYRGQVYEQWWTDKTVTSAANGTCGVHGFKGDYDIIITTPSQERIFPVTLRDNGSFTLDIGNGAVESHSRLPSVRQQQKPYMAVSRSGRKPVHLELSGVSGQGWSITLSTLTGRTVFSKKVTEGSYRVPLEHLSAGTYTAVLQHSGGQPLSVLLPISEYR